MSLIDTINSDKPDLLNLYFTAGYPELDSLPVILEALDEAGVDLVEIGIPYSDPLADGPTIQRSSSAALANGITLDLIFEQLGSVTVSIPKIMMGYFNTVLQYGVERFCQRCRETGVEGLILPDLPLEIAHARYAETFRQYGLYLIYLVTPQTSEARIRAIDDASSAFIYAVSSSSTTGKTTGIRGAQSYLERLRDMELTNPFLVGFNISTADDFAFACSYARGGIIGSAFIKHLSNSSDLRRDIPAFVSQITQPVTT